MIIEEQANGMNVDMGRTTRSVRFNVYPILEPARYRGYITI